MIGGTVLFCCCFCFYKGSSVAFWVGTGCKPWVRDSSSYFCFFLKLVCLRLASFPCSGKWQCSITECHRASVASPLVETDKEKSRKVSLETKVYGSCSETLQRGELQEANGITVLQEMSTPAPAGKRLIRKRTKWTGSWSERGCLCLLFLTPQMLLFHTPSSHLRHHLYTGIWSLPYSLLIPWTQKGNT